MSNNKNISLIAFIDDNPFFLDAIKAVIGKKYDCIFFDCPLQAEACLSKVSMTYIDIERHCYGVVLNNCYDDFIFYNPISIRMVISDYFMPSIDGVMLYTSVRDLKVPKVLLTTYVNSSIEHAMSQGIITECISKNSDDLFKMIDNTILLYSGVTIN